MKAKILTAFLMVISVLFISEAFFFVMHFIVVREYQRITDNVVSEYRLIDTTSNLVNSFYDLIQYSNDQQRMNAFNENLTTLQSLLSKLDSSITDSSSWAVYSGVKSTINGVVEKSKKGVDAVLTGNFSTVTPYYQEANQKNGFVKDNAANLILMELGHVEESQARVYRIQKYSEVVGLTLFLLVLLYSFWYALSFSQRLAGHLSKLVEWSKAVSGGNFEAEIDKSLKIENGELAKLSETLTAIETSLMESGKKVKDYEGKISKAKKIIAGKEEHIKELSGVSRTKSELMSIVIHELKTSLVPIFNLSEVMDRNKESLSPDYQKNITAIREEGIRLNNIVRQMLQAVSGENGNGIEKERFNLDELIMSLESSLRMLADRRGGKIILSIRDRGVVMNSDREKISQVIYNFVDNAVAHGPNGQTITVVMKRIGEDMARVEVIDEGEGLSKEKQEGLFSKFFNPSSTSPGDHDGMGLGLYVCKRNIKMLQGEIGVTNGDNKGAIFYFTIPLIIKEEKDEEEF